MHASRQWVGCLLRRIICSGPKGFYRRLDQRPRARDSISAVLAFLTLAAPHLHAAQQPPQANLATRVEAFARVRMVNGRVPVGARLNALKQRAVLERAAKQAAPRAIGRDATGTQSSWISLGPARLTSQAWRYRAITAARSTQSWWIHAMRTSSTSEPIAAVFGSRLMAEHIGYRFPTTQHCLASVHSP